MNKEYVFIGNAQNKTRDMIYNITTENKKLQQRIDKAIEYIEFNDDDLYTSSLEYNYDEESYLDYYASSYREDLLSILKGEEDEKSIQ